MAQGWARKYGDEPGMGGEAEMIETPEDFGPAATKWTWD